MENAAGSAILEGVLGGPGSPVTDQAASGQQGVAGLWCHPALPLTEGSLRLGTGGSGPRGEGQEGPGRLELLPAQPAPCFCAVSARSTVERDQPPRRGFSA